MSTEAPSANPKPAAQKPAIPKPATPKPAVPKPAKGARSRPKRLAPEPLSPAVHEWRILVRRIGTGVGALCGLVSLLCGAPAWVACMRGGAASFLIAVLGRQGERFLSSSAATVPADDASETPSTPTPDPSTATSAE